MISFFVFNDSMNIIGFQARVLKMTFAMVDGLRGARLSLEVREKTGSLKSGHDCRKY